MSLRTLQELLSDEPAWPEVASWVAQATVNVRILPNDAGRSAAALLEAQVTTWSALGAVVYETGGLVIDHGWLRVLGGGCDELAWSPAGMNRALGWGSTAGVDLDRLCVAANVVGGIFAMNCGFFAGSPVGHIHYLAPDTARWEPLNMAYSKWLRMMLGTGGAAFNESIRWQGWEAETGRLKLDQGLSVAPPLWAKESWPREGTLRRAVPWIEVLGLALEHERQLRGVDDGRSVQLKIE